MCIRWALSLLLFCRICFARLEMAHCSLLAIPIKIIHCPYDAFLQMQRPWHKTGCTKRYVTVVHFIISAQTRWSIRRLSKVNVSSLRPPRLNKCTISRPISYSGTDILIHINEFVHDNWLMRLKLISFMVRYDYTQNNEHKVRNNRQEAMSRCQTNGGW